MVAVIQETPSARAYIYSLPKQENIAEYPLNTTSNIRVNYDTDSFKTAIISDLDNDEEISNELPPYGILNGVHIAIL